jgi:ubiquinone/menaquinone biosynthesis C-methylase UbiE
MFEAKFGTGILSQGEIITTPEQHRLIAKRAWMSLADYFRLNDEFTKIVQIPLPWSLDEDSDIRDIRSQAYDVLARFANPDSFQEYVEDSEFYHTIEIMEECYKRGMYSSRLQWLDQQVTAENPKTVLDVGVGWGEVSRLLADRNYMVTGICPNQGVVDRLNKLTENSSAEFLCTTLEEADFGDRRFDVVVATEILEHVAADRPFLRKCCDLAERAVLLTTPVGSTEYGFFPNADWRENLQHVRSYSHKSFESLVTGVGGDFEMSGGVEALQQLVSSYNGHPIYAFCCKLVRTKEFSGDDHNRNRSRAVAPSGARSG